MTVEERIREALGGHGWDLAEWDVHKPLNRCICGEMVGNYHGDFHSHLASVFAGMVREAQAKALRDAAADTRARGDIGKDGGCEAWDYLNWRADRIEKANE